MCFIQMSNDISYLQIQVFFRIEVVLADLIPHSVILGGFQIECLFEAKLVAIVRQKSEVE